MKLYTDVETVRSQGARQVYDFTAEIKAPSNYTKPEAIAAYGEKKRAERFEKSALTPLHDGELVCISRAFDDGEIVTAQRHPTEPEGDFLRRFWAALDADGTATWSTYYGPTASSWSGSLQWIAHNAPFDLGFLFVRSKLHGVPLPLTIPWPVAPWDKNITDTCFLLAGNRVFEGASLKNIASLLGLEALEMTPEEIEAAWKAGDPALAEYNRSDVHVMRAILKVFS